MVGGGQLGGRYLPRVISPPLFNGVGSKMVPVFSELLKNFSDTEREKKIMKSSCFTQKKSEIMGEMPFLFLGQSIVRSP